MQDTEIAQLLPRLRSSQAQEAWAEFLGGFSPLILQVIQLSERDDDSIADCYLFVCEQLSQKQFRRLTLFRADGPASFRTWLRVVVRNLCLDWRRREFGRHRIFESVQRLPAFEREVFSAIFEQNLTTAETFLLLSSKSPSLREERVEQAVEQIRRLLTPRQLWLLQADRPQFQGRAPDSDGPALSLDERLLDSRPSPETLAAWNQQRARLARVVADLPASDRLLLRLRYEEDLTFDKIARIMGLKDAQAADRRIRDILARLQASLG
ncbi:MAG: RNA polymerase sigma factor [Terriglobia bacterium]